MIWADYAIIAAIPIIILGGGIETLIGETRIFAKKAATMVVVNLVALCMLVSGLYFQEHPAYDEGFGIISQIQLAFARAFGGY